MYNYIRGLGLFICLLAATATMAADVPKGNIHPKLKLGFSERFRLVSWDNAISLDKDADAAWAFTRHRTSLSANWYPRSDLELTLKLTNECRYYVRPAGRGKGMDELFVDQLYVKFHVSRFVPGTLTVGRQNIILGEGFVVMDGHPLDGSRSIYFNAVRFDAEISDQTILTAFYSYQPETDEALVLIHDVEQHLVEQPEQGACLYLTTKVKTVDLHAYYIYKHLKEGKTEKSTSEISTVGVRASAPITARLSMTGEFAGQFGNQSRRFEIPDWSHYNSFRRAYAGYAYATWNIEHRCPIIPGTVSPGGFMYSGHDIAPYVEIADLKEKWNGWEPVFARWPKWSESYIYTQIRDQGVAYWTNIASLFVKSTFEFYPGVGLNLDYFRLYALKSDPRPGEWYYYMSEDSKTRGDLLIARLNFAVNDRIKGHLLWEAFFPGDFYPDDADNYSWLRAELSYRI